MLYDSGSSILDYEDPKENYRRFTIYVNAKYNEQIVITICSDEWKTYVYSVKGSTGKRVPVLHRLSEEEFFQESCVWTSNVPIELACALMKKFNAIVDSWDYEDMSLRIIPVQYNG